MHFLSFFSDSLPPHELGTHMDTIYNFKAPTTASVLYTDRYSVTELLMTGWVEHSFDKFILLLDVICVNVFMNVCVEFR